MDRLSISYFIQTVGKKIFPSFVEETRKWESQNFEENFIG